MSELILEKSHIAVQKTTVQSLSRRQEIFRNTLELTQVNGLLNVLLKAVVGHSQHPTFGKCTSGHILGKDHITVQSLDVGEHLLVQQIIRTTCEYIQGRNHMCVQYLDVINGLLNIPVCTNIMLCTRIPSLTTAITVAKRTNKFPH